MAKNNREHRSRTELLLVRPVLPDGIGHVDGHRLRSANGRGRHSVGQHFRDLNLAGGRRGRRRAGVDPCSNPSGPRCRRMLGGIRGRLLDGVCRGGRSGRFGRGPSAASSRNRYENCAGEGTQKTNHLRWAMRNFPRLQIVRAIAGKIQSGVGRGRWLCDDIRGSRFPGVTQKRAVLSVR